MKASGLSTLKFFSLLFLLPGIAGLIFSAMVSTQYASTLPQAPVPEDRRMTPRNIHGTVVFQTDQEDLRLTVYEDASLFVFCVGMALGLIYLEKWGSRQLQTAEDGHALEG